MTQETKELNTTEVQPVDTHEEVHHEHTLYAEPIAHIGSFTVTNALFTSWVGVFILIVIAIAIRIKLKQIPKGIQNFFEFVIEGAESLADQVTGDRKITDKAFPIVFTVFLVVLINNWLGIMPFGGLGFIEVTEHGKSFIPLVRSGTADVNGTLPLAILSVLGANLFGIISLGIWKSINKYVNLKALGEMFTKVKKDPAILMTAPIMFAVGFLELIGECAKIASLSFRLFGNVFAGEVLLASMGAIMAYLVPTPFLLLEVFVGVIQAFIFAILTLVYYTMAASDHDHEEEHHAETSHAPEMVH
ncbi:MAG: FoF1 ATP synthase subunit a [Candidatus Paceibacterota bacterium]